MCCDLTLRRSLKGNYVQEKPGISIFRTSDKIKQRTMRYPSPNAIVAQSKNCLLDVLLTVHLSVFILIINQHDAQNLFFSKFISCLYMFRAPCAHRQEVKILLYSLWYHHTYRWPSRARKGHL